MPQEDHNARFHIVTKGSLFWLKVDQVSNLTGNQEGDILIVSNGIEHQMLEKQSSQILSQLEFESRSKLTDENILELGDQSDNLTNIVCGHFSFLNSSDHPFLQSLPNILHIKKSGQPSFLLADVEKPISSILNPKSVSLDRTSSQRNRRK